MYEYLAGIGMILIIWLILFIIRKDLRTPMIWGGAVYVIINVLFFILMWILFKFGIIQGLFVPDYWNPDTLFDLTRKTGGVSIEDILFAFFAGGIATSAYEEIFGGKIRLKKSYKPHFKAVIAGYVISGIIAAIYPVNAIYPLILSGFIGAIVLWIERKDLIKHSLIGGGIFMVVYILAFSIFNFIFPDFIQNVYNINEISGIILLGLPLEEILYAISFGLLWAPLYEYAHGEKNTKR